MRSFSKYCILVGVLSGCLFFIGARLAAMTYHGFDAFIFGALIAASVAATAIPAAIAGRDRSSLTSVMALAIVMPIQLGVVASLVALFPSEKTLPTAHPFMAMFGAVWAMVIIWPSVVVVRRTIAENRER